MTSDNDEPGAEDPQREIPPTGRPKGLKEGRDAIDREFDLYDQDPKAGERAEQGFVGSAAQISEVLGSRRCAARKRDGDPCSKTAEPGLQVCRSHGATTQARASARLRLQELAEPAVAKLARLLVTADDGTALRAANSILDRTGFARQSTVSIAETQDIVLTRLLEFQARKQSETPEQEHLIIEPPETNNETEKPDLQENED